jgi:hypothetical protein
MGGRQYRQYTWYVKRDYFWMILICKEKKINLGKKNVRSCNERVSEDGYNIREKADGGP